MLLLTSTIGGGGFGGIQMVNHLMLAAARAAGLPGSVVCLNDPPDAAWQRDRPAAFWASGSRPRLGPGARPGRRPARGSVTLVTHVGLAPVGRMVRAAAGGQLAVFLHGVEAARPMPRLTAWGLRASDRVVANSRFTLDAFRACN